MGAASWAALGNWPAVRSVQAGSAFTVTAGVEYASEAFQTAAGPVQGYFLRLDLGNPNVRLGVVQAQDRLVTRAGETVSSMALRTGAVAGVNGDFFVPDSTWQPISALAIDGEIWQSPYPNWAALVITRSQQLWMGPLTFSGQPTVVGTTYAPAPGTAPPPAGPGSGAVPSGAQPASMAIGAVNQSRDIRGDRLTLVTPRLGAPLEGLPPMTVAYLEPVGGAEPGRPGAFQLVRVERGVSGLPALSGQEALVATAGPAADWLAQLAPGATLQIEEALLRADGTPIPDLRDALGGGPQVVRDGALWTDPHPPAPNEVNQRNPLTAIGVSADGRRVFLVVVDGRQPARSIGLTHAQMGQLLRALGAWNAMLFDSGGSSTMVVRLPGQFTASLVNSPSDGHERPVANGLFVYSALGSGPAGPARSVLVHGGQPLTVLVGTTVPLPAAAFDTVQNPVHSDFTWSVAPSGLADVAGGQLVARAPGSGRLTARAPSGATGSVPLTVVARLASLSLLPPGGRTYVAPGEKVRLELRATGPGGQPVELPASAARWSVSDGALGSVSPDGLFTAASGRTGLVRITATAGGATAGLDLSVGEEAHVVEPMDRAEAWQTRLVGLEAKLASSPEKAHPGDSGSLRFDYRIQPGPGTRQLVFWPKKDVFFRAPGGGRRPVAVGLWVRGDASGLRLAVSLEDARGRVQTLYPATLDFSGWRMIRVAFPAGFQFPVRLKFLDFLVASPSRALQGTLFVSDLSLLTTSLAPPAPPSPPAATVQSFRDVPASFWAYGAIRELAALGVVDGLPDGSFRPVAPVTRAELVKMLLVAQGTGPAAGQPPFPDVTRGSWYAPWLEAAWQRKLLLGADGLALPERPVTRQEAALLLLRAAQLNGAQAGAPAAPAVPGAGAGTPQAPAGSSLRFRDSGAIAPWALEGVEEAVRLGLLQGFPDGSFRPRANLTRAEAAVLVQRLMAARS
ncbi:MAG: phosphodiester glycosidase family protein [Chloroflexi bacterium]|nr:phosphodiester glycosidase family protein [Chloroflexota bacterium]